MKSNQILRILSLVGFLLLIAPFYQQCHTVDATAEEVAVDTTAIEAPSFEKNKSIPENNKTEDSIVNQEKVEYFSLKKAYEFIDDDDNLNAFELAYLSEGFFQGCFEISLQEFKEELSKDLKKQDFDGLFFLVRTFSFVFIVLISFCILVLSFTKKTKWIYKLSKLNLFFIILALVCILFFDSLFKNYKQIKWGFYVFTFVQIAIYYISKLNSKTKFVSS